MKTKDSQCKMLLLHLLQDKKISGAVAFRKFGILSGFHRRLTDLRTGVFDGKFWPVNYGTWAEYGGKRFKVYGMDMEAAKKMTKRNTIPIEMIATKQLM